MERVHHLQNGNPPARKQTLRPCSFPSTPTRWMWMSSSVYNDKSYPPPSPFPCMTSCGHWARQTWGPCSSFLFSVPTTIIRRSHRKQQSGTSGNKDVLMEDTTPFHRQVAMQDFKVDSSTYVAQIGSDLRRFDNPPPNIHQIPPNIWNICPLTACVG